MGDIYLKSIDQNHRRFYEKCLGNENSERDDENTTNIQQLYVSAARSSPFTAGIDSLSLSRLDGLLSKSLAHRRSTGLADDRSILHDVFLFVLVSSFDFS